MADFYEQESSEPELREYVVKFVGGTAAVTKVYGNGVTVTYISTGIVDLVFATPPGPFVGCTGRCFEATTQSQVKGYTVVPGAPSTNTTTGNVTLRLNITNASEALADLAALQWLTMKVAFKATGV